MNHEYLGGAFSRYATVRAHRLALRADPFGVLLSQRYRDLKFVIYVKKPLDPTPEQGDKVINQYLITIRWLISTIPSFSSI